MFADRALDLLLRSYSKEEIQDALIRSRRAARLTGAQITGLEFDPTVPLSKPDLPVSPTWPGALEILEAHHKTAVGELADLTMSLRQILRERAQDARKYPIFHADARRLCWARDHIPRDPTMLALPYPITVINLNLSGILCEKKYMVGDASHGYQLLEVCLALFVFGTDLWFWVIAHDRETLDRDVANLHVLLRFSIPLAEAVGEPDPIPPHGRVEFKFLDDPAMMGMTAPIPGLATALRLGVDCGLGFLSLVNLRKGTTVRPAQPQVDAHGQRRRARNGLRPLLDFHVIELDPTLEEAIAEGAGDGTARSPRQHWCRGHFKHRKTGVFWWSAHMRGDKEAGHIEKEYRVAQGPTPGG